MRKPKLLLYLPVEGKQLRFLTGPRRVDIGGMGFAFFAVSEGTLHG